MTSFSSSRGRGLRGLAAKLTAVATLAGLAALSTGCEEIPNPGLLQCADFEDFKAVSPVLERRCGTLDCHGEYARPLRIQGQNGLRGLSEEETANLLEGDGQLIVDNMTVTGGKETTEEEVRANWRSVCGLEPERTSRVINGALSADELMLLRKPLQSDENLEKHKGGQLFFRGGPGDVCIRCWLIGFPDDVVECADAVQGCADATSSGTL